jgi:ABC-2 type transport system ATP-binding protein
MRADLCASLLHNPRILFLDEPTIGLDVVVKKQIREMIRNINAEKGVSVILTTHDMKDIEEICGRIIMIDKGKIIIDAPMGDVKNKFKGSSTITVVFDKSPVSLELDNVENVKQEANGKAVISYNSSVVTSTEIISTLLSRYKIVDISMKEPEIDEIIRNLYAHQ